MKIFISWSGDRSRAMANFLHGWLKSVLQATEPWVSTTDIPSGTIWMNQITEKLAETSFGLLCLTPENRDSPFIHFEAGAISNKLDESRVMALVLFEQGTSDIIQPLGSFNLSLPDYAGVFKLVKDINSQLISPLADGTLLKTFDAFWPEFEAEYKRIKELKKKAGEVEKRDPNDILVEILTTIRGFDTRLRNVESNIPILKTEQNTDAHYTTMSNYRSPDMPGTYGTVKDSEGNSVSYVTTRNPLKI